LKRERKGREDVERKGGKEGRGKVISEYSRTPCDELVLWRVACTPVQQGCKYANIPHSEIPHFTETHA